MESLEIGTLMSYICQNNIKFQLKKYRRVNSHELTHSQVIFHDIEQ